MQDSIPIHRDTLKHWIYSDAEYFKVWVTMLARARYLKEPKTIMYEKALCTLNYGEFIFGYKAWSNTVGISYQRLRGLINKLLKDNMLTVKTQTNHFTVYEITNYSKFNSQTTQENKAVEDLCNRQVTVSQQSGNSQVTTNKEGNKKDKKDKKNNYSEFVKMTTAEYDRLVIEFGQDAVNRMIEILNNYKGASGKKYANDNLAIRNWVIKRYEEESNQTKLFGNQQPKQTKRDQSLNELERILSDYDRSNVQDNSRHMLRELS